MYGHPAWSAFVTSNRGLAGLGRALRKLFGLCMTLMQFLKSAKSSSEGKWQSVIVQGIREFKAEVDVERHDGLDQKNSLQ